MNTQEMVGQIAKLLDEKKGYDIVAFNIGKVSSLADAIIVASGNSDTHVNALADYVVEEMKKEGMRPLATDGYRTSRWVCVDYGDIMVNILGEYERDYYSLESIWGGTEHIDLSAYIANPEKSDKRRY